MEGKFVLDKDSEEGGFTSPRKPIRSLLIRRISALPYTRQPKTLVRWVNRGKDHFVSPYYNMPSHVEGGVYDVRAGTTRSVVQEITPRIRSSTESRDGLSYGSSGVRPGGVWEAQYLLRSPASPEFGRHHIPDSPESTLPLLKQRRIRSSSPRPYVDEWNQLAQLVSFSDEMSSVRQPSSVERSFPSTVLSSFQNSTQRTPSMHGTPLNAASLLQESANMEYDRVIQEQERLLQQNKLLMRQQELQRMAYSPSRIDYKNIRPIDAQIHSSYPHPQHLIQRDPGGIFYPGYFSSWSTPHRPSIITPTYRTPHVRFRSPRASLFHPPYREPFIFVPKSYSVPHHYVNVPPRQGPVYQRILGEDPSYYLLKPSSSETPKPLATSSPPRSRVQPHHSHIHLHQPRFPKDFTETDIKNQSFGESDTSIDQPAVYTRDRLQRAIGKVRSGLRGNGRPHSAPNLSSAGRTSVSFFDSDKKYPLKKGQEISIPAEDTYEKSDEISHEQSPNSSSGFGSKNTSQQQSSSQSGQSASALGLDVSRFESSEMEKHAPRLDPIKWNHPSQKQSFTSQTTPQYYGRWIPRHVLPQFRIPFYQPNLESSLLMGVHRPNATRFYQHPPMADFSSSRLRFPTAAASSPLYQNINNGEWNSLIRTSHPVRRSRQSPLRGQFNSKDVLTVGTSSPFVSKFPFHIHSAGLTQPSNLDISVDDHYEFDTLLSPTPGVEDTDLISSRSRTLSGERGLSDSEIYSSGGKRKEDQESMEARVAAMKQEFHEYRQRQAKRRSNRELESVC